MDKDIKNLLQSEAEQVKKLRVIVETAIEDEKLIIENLQNPPKDLLTRGQKISDRVARFGGSWAFIISFFVVLAIWIIYNVNASGKAQFDPYPFILMNLILSCIAASPNHHDEPEQTRGKR